MNVLIAHNRYKIRGGEDARSEDDVAMLRARGHTVHHYVVNNDGLSGLQLLTLPVRSIWSQSDYRKIREIIRHERIDIVHVHNYQPLISPAIFHAAHREGVPAVMTLHNYRLICPAGQFLREHRICEECVGKSFAYPGIVHACYRESRIMTGAVAAGLAAHRWIRTWDRSVSAYIVLTEFARNKFTQGGLPAAKLYYRPNFVPDTGVGKGRGGYVLFVGRLSPEKGINVMLDAWKTIGSSVALKIVGNGPLKESVETAVKQIPSVELLGRKTPQEVYDIMGNAAAVLVPSVWYEGAPQVILEAFAKGTPAIVSKLGGMESMVDHQRTGLCFEAGNAGALASAVTELISNRESLDRMRQNARAEYEEQYTEPISYDRLLWLYQSLRAGLPVPAYAANRTNSPRLPSA